MDAARAFRECQLQNSPKSRRSTTLGTPSRPGDSRASATSCFSVSCRPHSVPEPSPGVFLSRLFSYVCASPVLHPLCFHAFVQLKGEGGYSALGYGPGASLTDWTGGIPDTVEPVASACRTGTCHGKRAVLWNRSFDSSLSTNRAIEP